jgi:hypothetical protein
LSRPGEWVARLTSRLAPLNESVLRGRLNA